MGVLIPGTTPTYTGKIKADPDDLTRVIVTFRQMGKTVVEKEYSEFEELVESGVTYATFVIELTQEETLVFENGSQIEIQANAMFYDVVRNATFILRMDCGVQTHRSVM